MIFGITDLPEEVILLILEDKNIGTEDIVNFKATCNRFQQITLNRIFWRRKYWKRYFFIHKFFILILI